MNETMHDEENSSQVKDDTSADENVAEMQTYESNVEQNNLQENKLLITNFEIKVENQSRRAHNLFNRSTNIRIHGQLWN